MLERAALNEGHAKAPTDEPKGEADARRAGPDHAGYRSRPLRPIRSSMPRLLSPPLMGSDSPGSGPVLALKRA